MGELCNLFLTLVHLHEVSIEDQKAVQTKFCSRKSSQVFSSANANLPTSLSSPGYEMGAVGHTIRAGREVAIFCEELHFDNPMANKF